MNESVPPSNETLIARKYADREAQRIAKDPQLRSEIETLFRLQGRTTREIYTVMNGSLGLSEHAKEVTNLGVLNRVMTLLFPQEMLDGVYGMQRSEIFDNCSRERIKRARMEWQESHGLVVFTDDQTVYLFELRDQPHNRKGQRVDNEKVAAAMNLRFETEKFTRENCRQHAANVTFHRNQKNRQRKNARP